MTDDLQGALARLADRAPVAPLDLDAVSTAATRRRRARAAVVALPVLVLLLVLPVALGAVPGRTDRLSQPAAPRPPAATTTSTVPLEDLQASVEAEVTTLDGSAPVLSVRAQPDPVPLGAGRVNVELAFTATGTDGAPFSPYPYWSQEVRVDGGTAVLGMAGLCGRGWTGQGRPLEDPCVAALPPTGTGPAGEATAVPLVLFPRSGEGQTAPGQYRTEVALDGGQVLRLVVDVTARPPDDVVAQPSGAPSPATGTTVRVFFGEVGSPNCSDVRPVERTVPETRAVAEAALRQLFAGTTETERARGLVGYGPDTDGLLRSVRIEDGTAYVDLDAARMPGGFSTSCGGAFFTSTVTATLRQFPTVQRVVAALDGDPRAFLEFLQMGCPQEPPAPGDACDPAPFRSG